MGKVLNDYILRTSCPFRKSLDIKKSTLYEMVIFSFTVQIIVIQTRTLSQKEVLKNEKQFSLK